VAVGVGIGVGIYFINRSLTSVTGCIDRSQRGLSVSTKHRTYQLQSGPSELKPGMRVTLRGHKEKNTSGPIFRVNRVAHQYGTCAS